MGRLPSEADPYLEKLDEHWGAIVVMYRAFQEREPVIEFDVASGKVLVFSAREYIEELTDRTRERTRKQYRKTLDEGSVMVFVRDEAKQVLMSYVIPLA